jgi:hypothetical protein
MQSASVWQSPEFIVAAPPVPPELLELALLAEALEDVASPPDEAEAVGKPVLVDVVRVTSPPAPVLIIAPPAPDVVDDPPAAVFPPEAPPQPRREAAKVTNTRKRIQPIQVTTPYAGHTITKRAPPSARRS